MANEPILQALWAQAWQLAALALVVGLCVRYLARNRPHLAHALWLVVLLKCVTPPVWGSPIGVFSWLSPLGEPSESQDLSQFTVEAPQNSTRTLTAVVGASPVPAGEAINVQEIGVNADAAFDPSDAAAFDPDEAAQTSTRDWLARSALAIWGAGVIAMAMISAIRFATCWRRLRRSEVEGHPELESLVAELTHKLHLRRGVRLLVTASRVGPAVIGLWRPTILLPACVVRGRAAEELEPILAHELIHVRRGDLWVGLLQTVAQALWWFHPLVWLANRMISREAERCCDEEVIGELRCEPSRYARSLLGVLEWKRILIPAPAVPGVRAVEITSRRLERIMTLGQGCRRRTPWWCWGVMLVTGALALPGSPLRMVATEPDDAGSDTKSAAALPSVDQVLAAPLANEPKVEPVIFPEDFEGEPDQAVIVNGNARLQMWDVADLLTKIQQQLKVEKAEAKRVLWVRLLNAQRDPPVLQPPLDASIGTVVGRVVPEPQEPDGKAYWKNDTLMMSQSNERRKRTETELVEMRKYGFESVEIEIHFLTSPLNIVTDVSSKWTTLPMMAAKEATADLPTGKTTPAGEANTGVASFAVEKNLPVILDVLGEARAAKLIDSAQGDRRTNVMQAPRLCVPNGQSATVFDCTQTPFVVGFKNDKPQISIVSEGTTVRARPVLDGDKVHIDFEVVLSGLRSVEQLNVRGPDGAETTLQAPEVAQSRVTATIDAPLGQTVLIGGLKDVRDPKSKMSMSVLLTVKKAPLQSGSKQVSEVRIEGNRSVTEQKIRALIKTRAGQPLDQKQIDEDARTLLKTHLFTNVEPRYEDGQDGATAAVFRVVERATIRHLRMSGDDKQDGQALRDPRTAKPTGPTYAILGPITSGSTAAALDPPSQEEVLRAIEKAKPVAGETPPPREKHRENVRTTIEPISDYLDPPRVYPLIGPAQLHHAHYKCTIYCKETITTGNPRRTVNGETREVVYIDHNHFHMVNNVDAEDVTIAPPKPAGKQDPSQENRSAPVTQTSAVDEVSKEQAARDKKREESLFTMTYAVADLIIPFPNPVTIRPTKDVKPLPQAVADFQPLIELITSTVAPESWDQNGGECSVTTFPNNLSLVVSQTEKGHAEIAKLFQQLRENLDKQVMLDCRTIDDPDELFRLMKSDGKAPRKTGLAMLPPAIVEQAHRAAEAKGGRNVKLTVFNGQQLKATVLQEARDGKSGYITVQAMISKDKQTARLRIADSRERVRQPWQQEEMTVLECGSLLIDNARFHVLADLGVTPPEKDGAEPKPAFVLITPRVIDASDAKPKDKKPGGAEVDLQKSGKSLQRKSVPLQFTDEDQRQVGAGVQVTKVLYRPNEEYAGYGLAPVETIVSTRLDPSVDPIAEARRRGSIVAVVRMDADLEP